MAETILPQRQQKKRQKREVAEQLRAKDLQGLLLGAAVWVCGDADAVLWLDELCLGNLDGGAGTAAALIDYFAAAGRKVDGSSGAVRLGLEEAFFMAYAFRMLAVHELVDGAPVALGTEGWIPRTGLQYGADCVLYQKHPALAHSDYSVLIMPLTPGLRPPLSWHDIQITNRLSTQVSKRLLLLYVKEHGASDHGSPKCLQHFAVQERLVRRFVPEAYNKA
eukprot:scaffold2.g7261.t1